MVCTANDLSEWKDFPKGLRILLLDQDSDSAAEIKSKLESMDYIVSTFCSEDEALSAVSSKPESFHIAIVEVNTSNENGNFKFLETAKDLPTIMTSNINCLSTVMKCIALGAVEFLVKPLSEDKLRNIWQHVIHKAFNAGAESLKPVKESVISMLHLDLENVKPLDDNLVNTEDETASHRNDKYPAPSTPQLKQCGRSLDDGDCRDLMNCSEKESAELDVESKSVETTLGHPVAEATNLVSHTETIDEIMVKEEDELADGSKSESSIHSDPNNKSNHNDAPEKPKAASSVHTSCASKANRKKLKIDWTPELHKKFVKAVEQLGIDQAIPSRILELMKVDGLTRHNVASHLQKYRMHKRHILPKEDERRWPRRDHAPRSTCYPQKHIMPFPPYHSQLYPMWGAHHHLASAPVWGSPGYPPWQPSWHWKPYPEMQADAWGCPVMPPPPPHGFCSSFPQNNTNHYYNNSILQNSFDIHPEDEVIDMVVKEAINKPWLPLPLGLKPPSTESVLAELSRQGISPVPSHTRCSSSSY